MFKVAATGTAVTITARCASSTARQLHTIARSGIETIERLGIKTPRLSVAGRFAGVGSRGTDGSHPRWRINREVDAHDHGGHFIPWENPDACAARSSVPSPER